MTGMVRLSLAAAVMLTVGVICAVAASTLRAGTGGDGPAGFAAATSTAPAVTLPAARAQRFPAAASIRSAITYVKSRDCDAALAVVDTRGVLHGYRPSATFTSASVVKAMLLVQYLRSHARVGADLRATLTAMITESDNAAAYRTYAAVGARGLRRLARRAGMRRFSLGETCCTRASPPPIRRASSRAWTTTSRRRSGASRAACSRTS